MRLSVRLNFSLIIGVTLVSLALALYQAQSETRGLKRDLERHSFELAETLEKSASQLVANHAAVELQRLVDHFQNRQRVAGVAVYDERGNALAITSDLATRLGSNKPPVAQAALRENGAGKIFRLGEQRMHVFELPIKAARRSSARSRSFTTSH